MVKTILVAAAVLAAVAGGYVVVRAVMAQRACQPPPATAGSAAPVGGPVNASPDPSYWTDERLRDASPAEMPRESDC